MFLGIYNESRSWTLTYVGSDGQPYVCVKYACLFIFHYQIFVMANIHKHAMNTGTAPVTEIRDTITLYFALNCPRGPIQVVVKLFQWTNWMSQDHIYIDDMIAIMPDAGIKGRDK